MRALGAALAGLFFVCWVVFLLHLGGLAPLPELPQLTLMQLYGAAAALGWAAGMIYAQRSRHLAAPLRRRLFLLSFCGPPSLLSLLVAMSRLQARAPLVLLWSLCEFGIFYLVPVSFRSAGKRQDHDRVDR
ncbi:MAG TPA: hypothetical protein VKY89_20465 [Thermoanaerobaculia bacterium]|jgi:hypothetical protein|nr:hypothetical protein [Thermoanaerobaculia bacterium]